MTRYIVSALMSMFLLTPAVAQKKCSNNIRLSTATFFAPGQETKFNLLNQVGISYSRKLYKEIYVGLGYQEWRNWSKESIKRKYGTGIAENWVTGKKIGSIIQRYQYKMIDAFVSYKRPFTETHSLTGALGGSFCQGKNLYLDDYYVNPEPPQDAVYYTSEKKEQYWGLISQVSYDYSVLKGRFFIGADFTGRYYNRRTPQYDYGVHVGVNF